MGSCATFTCGSLSPFRDAERDCPAAGARRRLSHDLINELTVLIFANEQLGEEAESRQARHMVGLIDQQVARIIEVLRGVLRQEQSPGGCNGAGVVRETAALWQPILEHLGVQLELDLAVGAMWVQANSDDVRTILSNLLSNAVKYTPVGGKVALTMRQCDGLVVLEVANAGHVAAEVLAKLFHENVRGRLDRAGSGVGLKQVAELLAELDGTISVQSEPGEGTVFRVEIPCAAA